MKAILLLAMAAVLVLSIGCAQDPAATTNRGHTYAMRTQTGGDLQVPANTGARGVTRARTTP